MCCAAAEQRFASPPNENRLAELESLREFLKETISLLDSRTQQIAAPAERLRSLLMSKDKKATILEMAGALLRASLAPKHLQLQHSALPCCILAFKDTPSELLEFLSPPFESD